VGEASAPKRHTPEFKADGVRLAQTFDRPITGIATDLDSGKHLA
jgi:hypothetical protein